MQCMAAGTALASPLLSDALVILGAAGIVIPLFARFRITPIIGFILVGVLAGPHGLGGMVPDYPWLYYVTISNPAALGIFAELGIVMLLFSVGLELSFSRLWTMRRQVFGLGSLELLVCAAIIGAGLYALGNPPATALALGLALALSSTALVLRITGTRTPVGRAALSMLLFEDIALVPIVFLLGAMGSGADTQSGAELGRTLLLGGIVVVALMVIGRLVLPVLFGQAARTKSPELFLAISLLAVIAAALATGATGLSPIVGALVAGLLIAETDYHAEVEAMTEPFKGLALGIFLITIGMSLDLAMIWQQFGQILAAVLLVLVTKAGVTALLLRAMGARPGTSTEAGILMASPSETTLIVLTTATAVHLIDPASAQFWTLVTAIGMTVTPLLALLGRRMGRQIESAGPQPLATPETEDVPRAIVIGFGRVGRLVAEMLAQHDKPFLIVDADPDQVSAGQREGFPAVYGDAARSGLLDHLDIGRASAAILTMDDPHGVQRLVRKLAREHPGLPIIARARDAAHAAELYRAGATHAVPETLEASLQLSEAVLVDLGVPMGPVIASIHEKRDEMRQQIMEEGDLDAPPPLKTGSLRKRG
jgi:monovalent cation:H+ antiporter-2, CPA2 family